MSCALLPGLITYYNSPSHFVFALGDIPDPNPEIREQGRRRNETYFFMLSKFLHTVFVGGSGSEVIPVNLLEELNRDIYNYDNNNERPTQSY